MSTPPSPPPHPSMPPAQALGLLSRLTESVAMTGPQHDDARAAVLSLKLLIDAVPAVPAVSLNVAESPADTKDA